ncbi:MAG TPA: MFS transporter [Actinomycetota bacterium]|nr:MFS transporter [Actinomycetota bacterium]
MGKGFARIWLASTGSNLGDGVVLAALPLLGATYTSDPLLIGGLTVAAGLPWLGFSLVSGALVDRLDRRVVMVAVDVLRAAAVGMLALAVVLEMDSLVWVYIVMVLLGIGETLFDTAAQTILPAVVGPDNLEAANGRLFAAQVVTNQFIGPPLGGFLFAVAIPGPLLLDAVTFLISSVLLATISGNFRVDRGGIKTGLGAEIAEGLSYLWNQRIIRSLAIGAAVINFGAAGTASLSVLFATEELGLGPVGYGVLLGAGAIGSVLGSMSSAKVTTAVGRGNALVLSIFLIGVSLFVIGIAPAPIVAGIGFGLFGYASDVWNVIAVSHRQRAVPDRLLGRLNAAYRLLAYGALPLGALCAGGLARYQGLRAPYLAGAASVVALAFWFLTLRSEFGSLPAEPHGAA